jgi:hypothetical protein
MKEIFVKAKRLWPLVLLIALLGTLGPPGVTAQPNPHYLPLVLKNEPRPDVFRKFPYLLYTGAADSMTILWQAFKTPPGGQAAIVWGSTAECSEGKAVVSEDHSGADEHLFSYTITGRTPGSKTYYQINLDGRQTTGDFRTSLESGAETLTFYADGDTRTHPEINDAVLARLRVDVGRNPSDRQTFLLNGGDFINQGMGEADWDIEFFNPNYSNIRSVLASLPILGALGNHEMYSKDSSVDECAQPARVFRKYWPYPMYPTNNHFYYSFDYGPVHVSVVDPYTADYTLNTGPQYLKYDI